MFFLLSGVFFDLLTKKKAALLISLVEFLYSLTYVISD